MTTAVSPFVGRARELTRLRTMLDDARGGVGGIALLIGEPGIGKTRTTQEFAELAAADHAVVLAGRCYEGEWQPPFGPWVEAVSEHILSVEPAVLAASVGPGGSALADVIPAIRDVLPDLVRPPTLGIGEARYRTYEAFARLIVGGFGDGLVVVLDDLHWADRSSLGLLRHLGHSIGSSRLLIVGTYRDAALELTGPLAQVLAELDRDLPVERLRLASMDSSETTALLERLTGGPVDPSVAEGIRHETNGNPFFIGEVVRHMLAQGRELSIKDVGLAAGVSEKVRHAVGRRIARLESATGRLLGLAAAFSTPIELALLVALSELPEEAVLDCLDEALRAGLIRETDGDRYEFAHALVRQTLYDELSPSRKSRLHRRIAQALEAVHGERAAEHAAELASQYHRSSSIPGAAHGIPYALAAAEQVKRAHAHEHAVAFLRIAQELALTAQPPVRAEIACKLAIAEAEAMLVEEAQRSLGDALALLEEARADARTVAGFVIDVVWALREAGGLQTLLEPPVERALARLGDRRDLTWARLKLALTPVAPIRAGPLNAGRWVGFDPEAVDIARASGDELDYARTIETPEWRTHEQAAELVVLAAGWLDPIAKARVLSVALRSFMLQHRDIDSCIGACNRLLALGEEVGGLASEAFALTYLGDADAARGRFADAAERERQAYDRIVRLGRGHTLHQAIHSFRHPEEPDWEEMAEAHRAHASDPAIPGRNGLWHAAVAASAYVRAGNGDTARALIEHVLTGIAQLPPTEYQLDGVVGHAATAVWALEETDLATPLVTAALAIEQAGVEGGWLTSKELTIARMQALLGKSREAAHWFGRARTVLDARGQLPLRAVVDYDEALARTRADEPGAEPLLAAARGSFEVLGMSYWLRCAKRLAAVLEGRAARAGGLTRREAEILRMLAQGRTNREIAESLVVSPHTVTRHVANIYAKIGARNRAEATVFALRHEF